MCTATAIELSPAAAKLDLLLHLYDRRFEKVFMVARQHLEQVNHESLDKLFQA